MGKLTRGVLARDRSDKTRKRCAEEAHFAFWADEKASNLHFPGGDGGRIVMRKNGRMSCDACWSPRGFRRKYDVNFTLPRPGQVVEDVWIEL